MSFIHDDDITDGIRNRRQFLYLEMEGSKNESSR